MSDMKLTEIARGHLRVRDGAKSVTVYGEALLRGYGSPDFVLYQNSIEKWDAPNDQEDVTSAEKERLIQFLKEGVLEKKNVLGD
jgi:hypothetical protein